MHCSVIGVAGAVAGALEELVVVLRSIVQSPGDTPPVDIWELWIFGNDLQILKYWNIVRLLQTLIGLLRD